MNSETLLLIDGNALIHRAYHAIPPLTSPDGTPINAVMGFFSMLHRCVHEFKPTHMAICVDSPGKTFREELLPVYQSHRPKADDAFITQIPIIHQMIESTSIPLFAREGFEADDLIGSFAHRFGVDTRIIIVTGDKDIFQLINGSVSVATPQNGVAQFSVYDAEAVVKKMGVEPTFIPDYKALSGDPSDNYTGVPGVGPKTAIKLIHTWGHIEQIIEHVEEIEPIALREKIRTHTETAVLMKRIATIVTDLPLDIDKNGLVFTGFKTGLQQQFARYNIKSLSIRIFGNKPIPEPITHSEGQLTLF